MKTYLLTWNPKNTPWLELAAYVGQIWQTGFIEDDWSCGRNKSIIEGDRLFLLRQGVEPRGIVASGWATSDVCPKEIRDAKSAEITAPWIDVRFDVLLDADSEPIYPRRKLEMGKFAKVSPMTWDARISGTTIPADVAVVLEKEWAAFLTKKKLVQTGRPEVLSSPNEMPEDEKYFEGATKSVRVNVYERNAKARLECIRHYGLNCCVCGFNFEKAYGAMGIGSVHVHHLKPLSEIGKGYRVDSVKDLRPVCPNCHAMIHSRKQTYSIEEIKQQPRK